MRCERIGNAIVSFCSDPGDYRIKVDGKIYTFEFSDRFGPIVLNRRGDPMSKQPGPKNKFWWAVSSWKQRGKEIDDDGLCVWFTEPEDILRHIAGRHYIVIGETEPIRGE